MSEQPDKIARIIVTGIVQSRDSVQIQSAYTKVKELILDHFGPAGDLYEALIHLEKRPGKRARQQAIEEEIECVCSVLGIYEAVAVLESCLEPVVLQDQQDTGKQVIVHSSQVGVVGDYATIRDVHFHDNGGEKTLSNEEVCNRYRTQLQRLHKDLPLRGVDVGVSDPGNGQEQMALDQVYISLDTRTPVKLPEEKGNDRARQSPEFAETDEKRLLSALEATVENRCVVLLGDPGSGKTTFLNHLTLCLALYKKDGAACLLADCWPQEYASLLPIPVVLRDFAISLTNIKEPAAPGHLWDFIRTRLEAQRLGFCAAALEKGLEQGEVVVLLDGLDEIPDLSKRQFIQDAIVACATRYENSRFIITCRVLSYQDRQWQLDSQLFPVFELASFDASKRDDFIVAWYNDLCRIHVVQSVEEAQRLTRRLQQAIKRPDLRQLAGNPLLLTVMALVNTHKGRLPDARALLYEETVDLLLWRWEEVKGIGEQKQTRLQELLHEVGRADIDLKKVLWQVAYDAHRKSEGSEDDSLADISEWELLKSFAALHPTDSKDWAQQLINIMKMRAGLLLEREPGVYFFPHRTFQEYLAGAYLSSLPDFSTKISQWLEKDTFWREAVLLGVGRLVYQVLDDTKALALVAELCPDKIVDSEPGWRKVWIAGEVLLEIGRARFKDSGLGREMAERVRHRLVDLLGNGALNSRERVSAGNVLSSLGDPRFDPDNWYLPHGDKFGFVRIPAGSFLMGSDKAVDQDAGEAEFPQRSVTLSEFWISRYPVTCAQYLRFLEDVGREITEEWRKYNQYDNHPVVEISWNDAMEYCVWLSRKMEATGLSFQLPTEAQWERAARGTGGNIFPWGNEPIDAEKSNYNGKNWKDGIGTSSVGSFPQGAAIDSSVYDLSGNVFEWVQDWYKKYEEVDLVNPVGPDKGSDRVMRGGSWYYPARLCRAAYRYDWLPDYRNYDLGFRLVLSGQQEPGPAK